MPTAPTNLDAIDLSNEKLKRLAGSGAFSRGFDYYQQDPQLVYHVKGSKVTANVSGSHDYQQELTFSIQGLDGHCSCPASENLDFCKHCVAVALAVRETQTIDPLAQKEKTPRISARQKELDLIKSYLQQLDRSGLEASLLSMINEDKTHFTQWALKAHNALNPADAKFLKKKITQAFPINKHLHRYSQVAQYFAQAEPIVDLIVEQREGLSADDLFMLADYALSRLGKALETVDDSGGYRFHCQDNLSQLFIEAVSAKQFTQEQLIAFLLEKLKENNEIAPDVPDSYLSLLGDEGVAAFYQSLLTLWRELPIPAENKAWNEWDEKSDYHHYFFQLKHHAQKTDDRKLLIELQQRNSRTASDLADLVDLLISIEEWEQATAILARAQKCSDANYVSNQLLNAEMKLLIQQDLYGEAYLLLEHAFSAKPSFPLYEKLHKFSELYGSSFEYYENSPEREDSHERENSPEHEDSLERESSHEPENSQDHEDHSLELDSFELGLNNEALDSKSQTISFDSQAILDQLSKRQTQDSLNQFTFSRLILDILFYHQRYADILRLEAKDKLPKEYLSRLIHAYPNAPEITLPLYEKLVASLLIFSDNEHYQQAIGSLLMAQKDAVEPDSLWEFNALLTRLKTTYKMKRNFIKYLNNAFEI